MKRMMKRIEEKRLREIQLNILDCVSEFCKENNIKYFLDCGTLLGAIRHKGYIPWDDDIDIGMLRDDYDKFIKNFNGYNKQYECMSIENNQHFEYPYSKIFDKNTVLYEPNEKGIKYSINIDLFVYDSAPINLKKQVKMHRVKKKYTKLNLIRVGWLYSDSKAKFFFKKLIRIFLLPIPRYYFTKKIVKNSKKLNNIDTGLVGNFTSVSNVICDKKVFNDFIEVEFEGRFYMAPSGYDEWLKKFYGDYMTLPPVEKQVSHHHFIAYEKEKDEI